MRDIKKLNDVKKDADYDFMVCRKKPIFVNAVLCAEDCMIKTLEGDMKANKGDMVIEGVNGELYPCKMEIFRKTYELDSVVAKGMLTHYVSADGDVIKAIKEIKRV